MTDRKFHETRIEIENLIHKLLEAKSWTEANALNEQALKLVNTIPDAELRVHLLSLMVMCLVNGRRYEQPDQPKL